MAGEYEHIKGKGNRFSSTNQPPNRGRKPKLYTIAKKGYSISLDEFREVSKYLVQSNKKELERLASDDTAPIWVVNMARALHKDTGAGRMYALSEILDRVFGRAASSVDVTTNGKDITTEPITIEVIHSNLPNDENTDDKSIR